MLLDQRLIVNLFQERSAVLVLGGGGDKVRPSLLVEPLLIGKHLVPDITAAAKCLFKQLRLGCGGIDTDLEGGELNLLSRLSGSFSSSRHRPPPLSIAHARAEQLSFIRPITAGHCAKVIGFAQFSVK